MIERITALLGEPNCKAWLRVLRAGESYVEDDDRAYHIRWGGIGQAPKRFEDLSRHPRILESGPEGPSSAAGAYQITMSTYDDFAPKLGISDFQPISQDLIALAICDAEGAIPAILQGNLVLAAGKLKDRWTSLRGMSLQRMQEVFLKYGGSTPTPQQPATRGTPMGPALFLPAILQMVPGLIAAFGKGEKAGQQAQAAQVVVDAFVKAVPGAVNAQDAVEKAQASPTIAATAKAAVMSDPAVLGLIEVGGGVVEARKLLTLADGDWRKALSILFSVPMIVVYMLMPLVYKTVDAVYNSIGPLAFSSEIRAMVVSAIISGVLFAIVGFALGTSIGSIRKDTLLMPQDRG